MKTYKLNNLSWNSLKKRLQSYDEYIKVVEEEDDRLVFEWNNSMIGFWYKVTVSYNDGILTYEFETENLIKWIIAAVLVLLIVFKLNMFAFILSSVLFITFFWLINRLFISLALEKMFIKLDSSVKDIMQEVNPAKKTNNVCPACGAEITPYDSHCPDCGLYLGKAADQPVSRSSYTGYRINYIYREKDDNNQT